VNGFGIVGAKTTRAIAPGSTPTSGDTHWLIAMWKFTVSGLA
jgi:hypothetical protein